MSTYKDPTPKATLARPSRAEIRCSGKLSCDCGARVKALDIEIEEVDNIERARLVCSNCHSDLLEVAL
jgi:hypothetical protein